MHHPMYLHNILIQINLEDGATTISYCSRRNKGQGWRANPDRVIAAEARSNLIGAL